MRSRLTFANVASALALFFALGGSAYAISVSGDDVVNNSLTGADVKKNSLKSGDIKGLGANVTVRTGQTATSSLVATSEASCQEGETLLSGGYGLGENAGSNPKVIFNFPKTTGVNPSTWAVIAINTNSGVGTIQNTAYALCAS